MVNAELMTWKLH